MSTWMQDVDELSHDPGKPRLSGRVHILGIGNVGCFVAHALASRQSPPPITLLLHHPGFYESFCQKKKTISIEYNGLVDNSTGFDIEVRANGAWHAAPSLGNPDDGSEFGAEDLAPADNTDDGHIECLIVCTKANLSRNAIRNVRHRLNSDSTILLLQNGVGVIELLNKEVFPDPQTRPNYMQGIFSHGLMKREQFKILHKGVGTMIISPTVNDQTPLIQADKDEHWAPSTKYLLRLLTLTPSLIATADTPAGLLQWQLEKLAVNCIINPLTALSDCKNGDILYLMSCTRVMRLLLFEISSVICALPELQGVPGIEARFSPERLRRQVIDVAAKTGANTSSMAQDMKNRNSTEIDFMNGWIVRRGEELGIKCVLNYMIQHLVTTKSMIKKRDEAKAIPIEYGNLLSFKETQRNEKTPDYSDTPDDVETRKNEDSWGYDSPRNSFER
ncbi:uncharacterized protein N7459_000680 [Penicillium hispanicum]|uniref:uncharacterized protein n=1 Tax=Penicillium hispanicum TaxID=1080232 RepID=UPI002542498A|nr:uncharacterized protein N7459_000680 [Penicillium hispanicum]KAJ5594472.1 hypothetical protein N7459_000680 [Penicillium hispanicum]